MARPTRIDEPGSFHHITNRGRNRQTVFRDASDFERFLRHLADAGAQCAVEVHAYVLMTNHYHLLVRSRDGRLSEMMQLCAGKYTQEFNARHRTDGALFKGRFFSKHIASDRYLLETMRYIANNPVKAGLVANARDYQWSSHGHMHRHGFAPSWVARSFIDRFFDRDPVALDAFVRRCDGPQSALVAHVLEASGHEPSMAQATTSLEAKLSRLDGMSQRSPLLGPLRAAVFRHVLGSFETTVYRIVDPLTQHDLEARMALLCLLRHHEIAHPSALADAFGLSVPGVRKSIQRVQARASEDARLHAILDGGRQLVAQAA